MPSVRLRCRLRPARRGAAAPHRADAAAARGRQPQQWQPVVLASGPQRQVRRAMGGLEELLRRHRLQPALVRSVEVAAVEAAVRRHLQAPAY